MCRGPAGGGVGGGAACLLDEALTSLGLLEGGWGRYSRRGPLCCHCKRGCSERTGPPLGGLLQGPDTWARDGRLVALHLCNLTGFPSPSHSCLWVRWNSLLSYSHQRSGLNSSFCQSAGCEMTSYCDFNSPDY